MSHPKIFVSTLNPHKNIERDNIDPLSIDDLEKLYNEIHPNPKTLEPCSEINPCSILPQITPNSVVSLPINLIIVPLYIPKLLW